MDDDPLATLQAEKAALEQKVAEHERVLASLAATSARAIAEFDSIFRAMADLYFRLDVEDRILDYRSGLTRDLYVPPERFMGARVTEVLPPKLAALCSATFAEARRTRGAARMEYELDLPSGVELCEAYAVPLEGDELVLVARNVTALKRSKDELSRTNAELEARVTSRTVELKGANESLRVFRTLADNAPDAIVLSEASGAHVYMNAACYTLFRVPPGVPPRAINIVGRIADDAMDQGREELDTSTGSVVSDTFFCKREDGTLFHGQVSAFAVEVDADKPPLLAYIIRDVTQKREAEEERLSLREQIIEAQRASLRELSTPLIPLSARVVAMPLIGKVDSERAAQIQMALLKGVARHSARVVLLDVTGVPSVDALVADALVRAARAVRLLGAELVLTGIRPDVAETLVALSADLTGIITHGSLERGIAYALAQR